MVTSNTHEALVGRNHLGGISKCRVAPYVPFPFSASCDDMLTMLVCATRWPFMHLYTLVYMSMHESWLLVCHPCFNIMKLWTFDQNLHLSLADTIFCFLSCFLAFSLVCSHPCCFPYRVCYAYSIYAFSYTLCILSCHRFFVGFLSLPLHVHTQSENAQS